MYSPDKKCLAEFNKIVIHDLMRVKKNQHIDLKFIIDIGANIGISTIYFKTLFPNANVISIEPNPDTFECLRKNTHFISGVNIEQIAYGNGVNCDINKRDKSCLCDYTTEFSGGSIKSLTMKDIFFKYELGAELDYFIKSDCEGAEKHFIGDVFCEKVILNARIFFMEVHFKSEGTPMFDVEWDTYDTWIRDSFDNTHNIDYFVSSRKRGYGHYLLVNKDI